MLDTILARVREPSTWAGIAAFGTLFGLPAEATSAVGQIVVGVGALAAIVLAEKKSAKP